MDDPRNDPEFAKLEYVEMLNLLEAWADARIDELEEEAAYLQKLLAEFEDEQGYVA